MFASGWQITDDMATRNLIFNAGLSLILLFAALPHGSAQYFENYNPNDDIFRQEIKLIDEFMERFDAWPESPVCKAYSKANHGKQIPRGMLLVSAFNLENTSFTDKDAKTKEFFHAVLNEATPVYINFNDTDWYAEAHALFVENGKLVELPIILHVVSQGDEWSKWMIAGIGKPSASKENMPSVSLKKVNSPAQQFISSSAHATNFAELHYLFTDNMQPVYYFDQQFIASISGKQFIDKIKNGKLKFQYVKGITFHFYQVKGWLFTVDQFHRKSFNSGWLISNILKTSPAEKLTAKRILLGR